MALIFLKNNVIELKGNLYSGNVLKIQNRLERALSKTDYLSIDLKSLKMLDVAGAFMLYLLTKKAKNDNKEIILLGLKNELAQNSFTIANIKNQNGYNESPFFRFKFYKNERHSQYIYNIP